MGDSNVVIKPCVVLLEQYTPKRQLALSTELKNAIHERNILTAKSKKKIFSALDEIDSDEKTDDGRRERKNFALQEILNTELTYLKQLETLMTFFVQPIRKQRLISEADVDTIFGNIKTIYEVNGALLAELKKDLTNVARAFLELAPFFKLYSVYACDYNKAIKKLESLTAAKAAFAKFIRNQETRPEVQSKLSALLIAPVQRIPRYCLLLQQVLDNSAKTDGDYLTLRGTLAKLQQAAKHINTLLAEKENSQRLLQLQKSLHKSKPLIVKPGRVLVKEGFLKMFSANNEPDERKYCILLNDILLLCDIKKPNIQSANSLECSLVLPLNKCLLKYHANTKIMHLHCDDVHLYVYHDSSEESEIWYNVLDRTIRKHNFDRQTLRKDNSLRKPANKKNLDSYSDAGVSPYKHRIRKRVAIFEEDDEENGSVKDEESGDEKGCFTMRPLKRKSIKSDGLCEETPTKRRKTEAKDSLFPLRYHSRRAGTLPPVNRQSRRESSSANRDNNAESDENAKPASDWKIVNVFSNFSRSLKRIFGYE